MNRRDFVIYSLIQIVGSMAFANPLCGDDALKNPAAYFEFVGVMSDKPIYPIVIAVREPSLSELNCALESALRNGAQVFVVDPKELARVHAFVESDSLRSKADETEFRSVIVKANSVTRFELNRAAANKLFADLEQYFRDRQPKLHDRLETLLRRLGGRKKTLEYRTMLTRW